MLLLSRMLTPKEANPNSKREHGLLEPQQWNGGWSQSQKTDGGRRKINHLWVLGKIRR
jgi:hypothetical protein